MLCLLGECGQLARGLSRQHRPDSQEPADIGNLFLDPFPDIRASDGILAGLPEGLDFKMEMEEGEAIDYNDVESTLMFIATQCPECGRPEGETLWPEGEILSGG